MRKLLRWLFPWRRPATLAELLARTKRPYPKTVDPEQVAAIAENLIQTDPKYKEILDDQKSLLWDNAKIGTREAPEYKRWMESDRSWFQTFGAEYPEIKRL